MHPFLKWVGGKTQIINDIYKMFPKNIDTYYEPFLGGGSVLIKLLKEQKNNNIQINKIIVGDINEALIYTYINIRDDKDKLLKYLNKIASHYNSIEYSTNINRKPQNKNDANLSKENYYYWIRTKYNNSNNKRKVKNSARFIFLNKTCFRGVYREGKNGFNVPFGHYKNPTIYTTENINELSSLFTTVEFTLSTYDNLLNTLNKHDFVYMDPPYAPINEKSFVGYNINGFDKNEHLKLFNICHNMKTNNIKFIMSNANVKLISDNFKNYKIYIIKCKRTIHSKKPQTTIDEVLITF